MSKPRKVGVVVPHSGAWIQLATRIPDTLHRRMKLYSVHNTIPLKDIIAAACEQYLSKFDK